MSLYKGIIIEESLSDRKVLDLVNVVHTDIESVTDDHKTPWLKQWTMHTVEVTSDIVDAFAKALSQSLLCEPGTWYADFRDERTHYIVFPGKVFKIDRSRPENYDVAKQWGLAHGVPEHQLDWSPGVE